MRLPKNCLDEYRKMIESMLVPKNVRIRASTEKLIRWVPEKVQNSVSTEKLLESGRVPGKSRIRVSIEKLFGCVPKKGSNQCEY